MSENLPKPTVKSKLEPQKFLEAAELHEDIQLSQAVIEASNLISKGETPAAKKLLESLVVGDKFRLPSIIANIDLQNRAKNGRVYTPDTLMNIDDLKDSRGIIKNWSNLAKLVQLYVIASNGSVQLKDFDNSLKWVDGNLERFTMQWLSQVISEARTRLALSKLKDEVENSIQSKALKWIAWDLNNEIKNTGKANNSWIDKRNLDIQVDKNTLRISSYWQTSSISLSNGKMTLGTGFSMKEYPTTVHLLRDRDTKETPIFIESEMNKQNIRNGIALTNLVHFIISEYMTEERKKSFRNTETPFILSSGTIKVDDGIINTTILDRSTLQKLLHEMSTNTRENPEIIVRFLNDIYREKNQPTVKNNGSTYIGGGKPISQKP